MRAAVAAAAAVLLAACSSTAAPLTGGRSTSPAGAPCTTGGRVVTRSVADDPSRPFLVATPAGGGRGRPLVVALHGSGGDPAGMEAQTRLAARGGPAGVSVVLPAATDGIWHNFTVGDEPYLDAVLADVLRLTCADRRRIVLTGFSNGGDEAQTLGCEEADVWRAVVVVSSSTTPDRCTPAHPPVSLLRVHGLVDHTSPYDGRGGDDPRDPVLPATQQWATHDGCRARTATTMGWRWSGCTAGATVELLALSGVGHEWPSRPDVTALVLAIATTGWIAPVG